MSEQPQEKNEAGPVSDDENILRRILSDHYDSSLNIPVALLAFRPTNEDKNGISVYRSLFTTPHAVASSGANPKGYYVGQICIKDLNNKNMTVVPNPLPLTNPMYLPGHALIPEINKSDYDSDRAAKKRINELQLELAILAGAAIVHKP